MRPAMERVDLSEYNPVLRNCAADTRDALLERGALRSFQPGDVLWHEGEQAGVAFLPLQGRLQLAKTAPTGRRQVFCYMSAANCPAICVLLMADRSLVDVTAVEAGQVLALPRVDLAELAAADDVVSHEAWGSVQSCMTHLLGMVENLSFHKVAERVVLALLRATNKDGALMRRTQAELAAEVGTTREVVARCLADLQEAGAIRLGRGRITVLDRERLQQAF